MTTWTKAKDEALETLRTVYRAEIERLAQELRPRFESGELHGYNNEDGDRESLPCGAPLDAPVICAPIHLLERRIEERMASTFPDAYLVLACSPSEDKIEDAALTDAKNAAAECVGNDVLRIARARGWYRPTPDEEPSDEELELDEDVAQAWT